MPYISPSNHPGDIPSNLTKGVELLSLDAGNTVIFLDHARLAHLVTEHVGVACSPSTLIRTEGEAKFLNETGALVHVPWDFREAPGALGWGAMVGTIVHRAGVPIASLPMLLSHLWREHLRLNLWSLVPPGLGVALDRLRTLGIKVVIVSNSEGMLDELFARLGIASHFDAVIDSGRLGIEKPDPRIFHHALSLYGTSASNALHLGDSIATDITGGLAAGMRVALIDPFEHCKGRHLDVPRVPSVAAVADVISATTSGFRR